MKIREIILVIAGTLAVLIFTGFMFDYYLRTEETQLIRRDMYFDSLILKEQKELRVKDSLLLIEEKNLKNKVNIHEYRLNKLEKECLELSK